MASAKATIRSAHRGDNEALLELAFRSPQAGRLLLALERSPDFFARAAPYDESRVFVAEDGSGIAGSVSCGLKSVLVQGQVQRAAYVFDLAVAIRARGQCYGQRLLAGAEAWAREKDADFLYAHVLGGNRAALATFTAARYRDVARLKSLLFPLPAPRRTPAEETRAVEEDDWPALGRLLHHQFRHHELLRAESEEKLRALWEGLPGYRAERVWVCGRPPEAILGLWDYSSIARAVLLRLPPEIRVIRAPFRLLRRAGLPLPAVPAAGQALRYGLILGGAGNPQHLHQLFLRALALARDLGLDALLLFHDPRTPPKWPKTLHLSGSYNLLATPLRPGPADRLGERPLWVDPVDL